MIELIVATAVGTVLGGLLVSVLPSPREWLHHRFRTELFMTVEEERAPFSPEYGFAEKAIKVTVRNATDIDKEIRDLRLIFCGDYGIPVLQQAPPPREHSALPVSLPPRQTMSWYFPAEKLASATLSLSCKSLAEGREVQLRPQIIDTGGKAHKGRPFWFSRDIHSHWP